MNQIGYVEAINAEAVGKAALVLGAGRETKESSIDLAVGIVIHKKIGDKINVDEPVATIYYNNEQKYNLATSILEKAYKISDQQIEKPDLIYDIIH